MFLNRILFPAPNPTFYNEGTHQEYLFWIPATAPDEIPFPCMFYAPQRKKKRVEYLIIFSHGNGCDLGVMHNTLSCFADELHAYVISFEYPSYGLCTGARPNQQTINNHALRTYNFVRTILQWPDERIVLYGHSIGSGAACYMASTHPVLALILQSPYTAISDLVREKAGRLVSYVAGSSWNNLEAMATINCPILFIHGRNDTLIPPSHSERLYNACLNPELSQLVILHGEDHNSMSDYVLLQHLRPFLTKVQSAIASDIPSPEIDIPQSYRTRPSTNSNSSSSSSTFSLMSLFRASTAATRSLSSSLCKSTDE